MTSKLSDLELELLDKIRDSLGPKPKTTLEDALEEALENTTPEKAGAPRRKDSDGITDYSEWI
jgi:hypothetical protein